MTALDHILRAQLPWRTELPKTECGRDADDVGSALTYEQAKAKFRELGQTRAVMTSCVTCFQTAQYRGREDWNRRPSAVVVRDAEHGQYGRPNREDSQLDRELRAIAALIEAHRDEFDSYLTGLAQTVNLAARRKPRRA